MSAEAIASSDARYKKLGANRKALRDYFVIERLEAGVELQGTEVKSMRGGHVNMTGAFARMDGGEAVLFNLNISPYDHGNRFNHAPDRPRKLLLHRQELRKVRVQLEQKGLTLIPLSAYLKNGWVKIELGLCKGKHLEDKRETLRRKTADREAARAVSAGRRGR